MKIMKKKKQAKKSSAPYIINTDPYLKKLEELRKNLARAVEKKKEEALPDTEVGDEGDVAVQSVSRDLVFELTHNERRLLNEVDAAFRRIEKNTFGICEACNGKVKIARLKFMPYARYCIKCASRFEHQ